MVVVGICAVCVGAAAVLHISIPKYMEQAERHTDLQFNRSYAMMLRVVEVICIVLAAAVCVAGLAAAL